MGTKFKITVLTKRIIPCLDIKDGRTVKGVNFLDLRDAGDAVELAMRYADDYRRIDGRWLFARRTLTFLYYVPVTEYGSVLATPLRLAVGGKRLPGDYPESLSSWQKVLATPAQA